MNYMTLTWLLAVFNEIWWQISKYFYNKRGHQGSHPFLVCGIFSPFPVGVSMCWPVLASAKFPFDCLPFLLVPFVLNIIELSRLIGSKKSIAFHQSFLPDWNDKCEIGQLTSVKKNRQTVFLSQKLWGKVSDHHFSDQILNQIKDNISDWISIQSGSGNHIYRI